MDKISTIMQKIKKIYGDKVDIVAFIEKEVGATEWEMHGTAYNNGYGNSQTFSGVYDTKEEAQQELERIAASFRVEEANIVCFIADYEELKDE